jgi:hypothetical protein
MHPRRHQAIEDPGADILAYAKKIADVASQSGCTHMAY